MANQYDEIQQTYLWAQTLIEHIHHAQEIAPFGAAPVTLQSGVGAYTWGGYSADIIAAGVTTNLFDLHWVEISNVGNSETYEIEFVYGAADTHWCYVGFTRTAPFTSAAALPLQGPQMPAGSRVRARMRDGTGNFTADVKVFYHQY